MVVACCSLFSLLNQKAVWGSFDSDMLIYTHILSGPKTNGELRAKGLGSKPPGVQLVSSKETNLPVPTPSPSEIKGSGALVEKKKRKMV